MFGLKNPFQKKNRIGMMQFMGLGNPKWSDPQNTFYAKEGYEINAVVFACVTKISEAVASIPMHVYKGDKLEENPRDPLVAILNKPNPVTSHKEFFKAYTAFHQITGNSYLEAIGPDGRSNDMRPPSQMWIWDPFSFKVAVNPDSMFPLGWAYDNGSVKQAWEVDQLTGASCLIHWKEFAPFDKWFGQSPLKAAARSVDQHNSASGFNQALLDNGAQPSGALISDKKLNESQFRVLQGEIDDIVDNRERGRPLLLEGGLQWIEMGLSPKDLNWLEGKREVAKEIAMAYGVPGQIIGIKGEQTFNNYKSARAAFYHETVIPLMVGLLDELNCFLAPRFGTEYNIRINPTEIEALKNEQMESMERLDKIQHKTINEKRKLSGDEPIVGGDTIYIGSGLLPLGFDPLNMSTEEQKMMKYLEDQGMDKKEAYELIQSKES